MSIQRRSDELVDLLRPDFVGNDGTASPTFVDEYLTGSHRASVSVGARVYRNADFVHNNTATWLPIDWTHQRWDDPDDNQWAVAPNPTRLTCQIDGIYVITAAGVWDVNATGQRMMGIVLNGGNFLAIDARITLNATYNPRNVVTTTWKMVATDFVEIHVYQNSGGNLNLLTAGDHSPEFSMVRVA